MSHKVVDCGGKWFIHLNGAGSEISELSTGQEDIVDDFSGGYETLRKEK
jgi:hypothetical protein